MKKFIFTLSVIFSLFISFSAFAADYSISDASWDVGDKAYATWDEPEDKTKYKVQLFKGNKKVSSNISTSSEKYDFTKQIIDNGSGSYTFKVYPLKGGSAMIVTSPAEYFDSETVSAFKKHKSNTTSNNNSNNSTSNNPSGGTNWYQTNGSWHYRKPDSYNATGWYLVNNLWYLFDANGNMQTGWIENNGYRYYLRPSNGDMATGWELIDNKWYYFDESGLYKTGWIEYKGAWYYLSANGDMVTNTTIDGYNINQDGIWVQ